jgi:L-fucose mutarotase/ribose pyranase (RbsD/FucU family)
MRVFALLIATWLGWSGIAKPAPPSAPTSDWKGVLAHRLPYYGHRNWIVIADSAYPAQSRDGIETVVSGADHLQVLQYVLQMLNQTRHVRPIVYTDRELRYIPEADAPGIEQYRNQLRTIFPDRTAIGSLPHEKIISQLDTAGQTFRVLIIKTNMALPYTSVFLQLDCAYWTQENEQKLRASMARQP